MTQLLTLAPGDQVVYPKHGPGVVRAITQRSVGGEVRPYYDIELRTGGMQVLVPVEKASALGLRRVLTKDEVPRLLSVLQGPDTQLPSAFPPRHRLQQAILEGGQLYEVAQLAGTLARRQLHRGLASSELSAFQQAKKAVVLELAVALDLSEAEAARLFDDRCA
ncbi:CarD family transcriptional regulator [Deinococcus peraridilitoris]|uniref:CarD-like transcriptional regulator n=1 Tax=Deinococcus peraridilitoris (strain DSM 19664 / LMG 22246 / CIP 109416 / KR-200) TaxID=937777 RepID=L0A388_DEIPD|nr:CarD family transcriptional regulator [Deinococcus peraridilitoris]AFZ68363.1 CarD-like transcriptional regulator [Deinococcus peraridilitoris DSM 19664]